MNIEDILKTILQLFNSNQVLNENYNLQTLMQKAEHNKVNSSNFPPPLNLEENKTTTNSNLFPQGNPYEHNTNNNAQNNSNINNKFNNNNNVINILNSVLQNPEALNLIKNLLPNLLGSKNENSTNILSSLFNKKNIGSTDNKEKTIEDSQNDINIDNFIKIDDS